MTSDWVPNRWSIRTKVVALVVGYILALGAVYGTFTVSLVRREAARTQDRLQQTATLIATELDAYLESGRQRLTTVVNLPGMIYGLPSIRESSGEGRIPPWTTLHYLFFKSQVFTGGVLLLDRDGKVLWTEPPGRPWVGRVLAHDPTMAAVYESNQDEFSRQLPADGLFDRPHVVIAAPVRGPTGEVEGVLGGIVDLTAPALTKILDAVSTAEGRFVELLDQDGRVLADSDALRSGQSERAINADGEMMSASVALAQAPWRVVVGQPRSLALAGLWQWQRYLLLIGIALLLLGAALGIPLINGVVRTIKTLTDAAAVIASGDLSRPVGIGRRKDELATLARSFEQMRVELEHSRAALERRLGEREDLIRLKEAFLAGISHELRTPLNAIIGYAEMLADEELTAEGRQQLMTVREQSAHLARMVADLLTLSGLNIGTLPVEISPVRVSAIVARLRPLAERLGQGKAVEVIWDCPPNLPTVETDPLRLEQILTNLLTNAFKFTARGRIAVRVVDEAAHGRLRFEVADTGIGIPPHELPHIFDEFRQAEGSLMRTYGGVGLGLALVKRLAELLHGSVEVDSEVGRGSVFTVALPLRFAGTAASAAA